PSFPPAGLWSRHRFPSTESPGTGSPASLVQCSALTSPRPQSASVALVPLVPSSWVSFAPNGCPHCFSWLPFGLARVSAAPHAVVVEENEEISQVPGQPLHTCSALRPRRDL